MQLSHDQQKAAEAFAMFASSEEKVFVLSGGAGVGKTTLLKHLMQYEDPKNAAKMMGSESSLPSKWILTATTNKAAEVLSDAVGREACTLHSLLGLTIRTDFKTGRQILTKKANSEVIENAFVVVDECSMVDTDLYRMTDEGTYKCKFLYIGDHCQMAPVMEELSPVFKNHPTHQLNEVLRSKGTPDITRLCEQLRRTVETGIFEPIQEVPGVIDFLSTEQAEIEIQTAFVDQNRDDCRILAYTNDTVIALNNYLRKTKGLPEFLTEGEKVVSNSVCYIIGSGKDRLRIEEDLTILKTDHIVQNFPDIQGSDLKVYLVSTNAGDVWVPESNDQLREHLRYYSNQKDWFRYYQLKERVADLRPRDAATVYKAQGSTYHTVFVHLRDIGTCRNPAQAARMLYVACSRPTTRICFLGTLPNRFGGP